MLKDQSLVVQPSPVLLVSNVLEVLKQILILCQPFFSSQTNQWPMFQRIPGRKAMPQAHLPRDHPDPLATKVLCTHEKGS